MTTNYIYRLKDPKTGEQTGRVGMVTIFDESEKHRVPEGATKCGLTPAPDDPAGAFFEAWRLDDSGDVYVDIERAKELRMEWLKKRREDLLTHLDHVQFSYHCSKSQERVDSVEETKNELRDFPDRINWDVIKTLHDVKHILPPCLV